MSDSYEAMRRKYFSHDRTAKLAYQYWLDEGRPDGEQPSHRFDMKVKEVHWWSAELMLECLFELDYHRVSLK